MALRTIVQDGDPILKKVCRPVTKFDDRLGTLLDDMKETLRAACSSAWMTAACPRRFPRTTSTSSLSSSTPRSSS